MWTIFTPHPRHRLSPRYFWRDTLIAVAPIAALSGIAVTITYAMLRILHPDNLVGVSTTTVIVSTFFGIYLVFLVPHMFDVINDRTARLARTLYVLSVVFVLIPIFGLSFVRDFFDFTTPAWRDTWPLLLLIVAIALVQWRIALRAGLRLKKREP
jgi:Kef-type K+ transport system membrane component KefB